MIYDIIIKYDEKNTNRKGSFFEELTNNIFKSQRYKVQGNVNYTGMEFDLECEHIDRTSEKVLVECKAKDKLSFDEITKYVIEPGVHQPGIQCGLFFNKDAYAKLPADLKWIVNIAARETQAWSNSWIENLNIDAINKFKEKIEFVTMDKETRIAFAKTTKKYLAGLKAKYPDVKKALDSQEQFKIDFSTWREQRSGVAPWPLDDYIAGKHMQ